MQIIAKTTDNTSYLVETDYNLEEAIDFLSEKIYLRHPIFGKRILQGIGGNLITNENKYQTTKTVTLLNPRNIVNIDFKE